MKRKITLLDKNGKVYEESIVSLDEMHDFAHKCLSHFSEGERVCLSGDLGSGKTTLVQSIAHCLGVKDAVESPTYIFMQDFRTENKKLPLLRHYDLYRVENIDELDTRGITPYLNDTSALHLIEWGDSLSCDWKIVIKVY